jgi:anti-sigma-K factor RskA
MNCDEVQELSELYVLGALEADVSEEIEGHLETCPDCRAEILKMWSAAQLLHLSVPLVTPPADLRGRILAAARGESSRSAPERGIQTQGLGGWLRRLVGAESPSTKASAMRWAAAAAMLPLILSLWLALQVAELRQQMQATELAMEQSRQTAYVATGIVGKAMESGSMAKLDGTEMAPGAQGFIYYLPADRQCVLKAEGLPAPGRDHVYQVWLQSGDKRMSGGVFSPEETGQGVYVLQSPMPLDTVDAVGISMEPRGGSMQPQGSRYMWGRLKRS